MEVRPAPGSVLGGKYRVIRMLGQGGMGAVFEAEHQFTQKRVALKWLHPSIAQQENMTERLVREAHASARIRHPNVVDIYDVGEDDGAAFLVMEYLEGEPLSSALERGDLKMHELIALLLGAMRGVAAGHRQGVVHRDIKPDNIFLVRLHDTSVPLPKVLDFGIAKVDPRGADQMTLTRTGSTMGTPLYMSYEQLAGDKHVDGRTDVYAFGVILYEALTGVVPYQASTLPELIVQIATVDPTPPKVRRPDIPTPLARVIEWAMVKDRDRRLPSLDVMIQELEPFATERGFLAQMTVVGGTSQAPGAHARAAAKPSVPMTAGSRPGPSMSADTPQAWQTRGRSPSDPGAIPTRTGARLRFALVAALLGLAAALTWSRWGRAAEESLPPAAATAVVEDRADPVAPTSAPTSASAAMAAETSTAAATDTNPSATTAAPDAGTPALTDDTDTAAREAVERTAPGPGRVAGRAGQAHRPARKPAASRPRVPRPKRTPPATEPAPPPPVAPDPTPTREREEPARPVFRVSVPTVDQF